MSSLPARIALIQFAVYYHDIFGELVQQTELDAIPLSRPAHHTSLRIHQRERVHKKVFLRLSLRPQKEFLSALFAM